MYLDGLNERQKQAVLTTSGPISVLAGAGSGKTRVLTARIRHLIREGTAPERILAVTFTNKAAREMRERLAKELGDGGYALGDPNPQRRKMAAVPFIATFHGLGRELLESYGSAIGIPRHFTIFDRDDSERAIKAALKALDVDPKEVPPRAILSRISKAKSDGMTPEEFRVKHGRESFRARITAEAWDRYEAEMKREKSLDFDDLLALPLRLLEADAGAREAAQARWDHLHIDEYQDTNALQGRLVNLLARKHRNVFVVGDIDQTIYTWRGATIDNLLAFDETYHDATTIILEHNYRSTKNIVDAANMVIEKNTNRKEKISVTDNEAGERIVIHAEDTADKEASWLAATAKEIISAGASPESIAVLFRTNFQSRALEEAFLRARVPYRLLGTRYFDRKEVKDLLSWVRLVLEPERESDRIRAVQSPPRGIGKTTLGKLTAGMRDMLKPNEITKVEAFEELIRELAHDLETLPASGFVRTVIEKSGMEAALSKGADDDLERLENIKELATLAARYDDIGGKEGIAAFLADAALAGDQDELDRTTKSGVTLMTVHAAKGLEFDTVFVTGMEEGLFPHEGMGDEDRDEEEERRLFYVAMTRARKRLFLTLARVRKIYGTDYFSEPSQFLRDIDPSLSNVTYGDDEPTIRI